MYVLSNATVADLLRLITKFRTTAQSLGGYEWVRRCRLLERTLSRAKTADIQQVRKMLKEDGYN